MQRDAEAYGKTVTLRMPPDQISFLEQRAEENERTFSAELRLLVRREMQQQEKRAA